MGEGCQLLIETNAAVAVFCYRCGRISLHVLSLFSLNKKQSFTCECGASVLTVERKNGKYWFIFECAFCQKEHIQPFTRKEIMSHVVKDLACYGSGQIAGCIGPQEKVFNHIKTYSCSLTQLALEIGSPEFFQNCNVMFRILERLYSMAEVGELYCQCGNHNLEIEIFPDRLELRCPTCSSQLVVPAALTDDLENFMLLDAVVMGKTRVTRPHPPKHIRRRQKIKTYSK